MSDVFIILLGIFFVLVLLIFYFANTIIIWIRFHHHPKDNILINMIIATDVLLVVPIVPQIMGCIILFNPHLKNQWASLVAHDADAANGLFVILITKLCISIIVWILILRFKKTKVMHPRVSGSSPPFLHDP